MWNYTNSTIDHFTNPRNVGEIEDANGVGQVGSLACGDALKLFLKIDPKAEIIVDAKFKTFGCASAIASASALTEMIKGKSIVDAQKITNDDIANFLGGLPEQKMHCSVMGREALDAAIANYRGQDLQPHDEKHENIICKCFYISEEKLRRVIQENNLTEVEQVTNFTKAGGGCGGCLGDLKRILQEEIALRQKSEPGPKKLSTVQRIALIQKVISEEIAPALHGDGGGVELIDVRDNDVIVKLIGACSHCSSANFTIQNLVQMKLREKVHPDIRVVEEL